MARPGIEPRTSDLPTALRGPATGIDIDSSARAAENRQGGKGLPVEKSSVAPRRNKQLKTGKVERDC